MDFTWNGMSAAAKGIVVTQLPPRQTAAKRDEQHVIPYRSGVLHVQDGSYDEIIKTCACYIPYEQGPSAQSLTDIRAWLAGNGSLTLSNDPGHRYNADIISQIDFNDWVQGYEDIEFQVVFECEPFGYRTDSAAFSATSAALITNPGTAAALPLITVTGSGDVSLMVGQEIILLEGLDGTVKLDCALQECYSESDGLITNQNALMTGEFPSIPTGSFAISWTGSATVTVDPRWRDI